MNKKIESQGLWFEELTAGLVIQHDIKHTVSESENKDFCVKTYNPQPLHLDPEFAATTVFGQRIVNSLLTLSLAVGVSVRDTTLGTTVANLGFEETTFPNPVFLNDTLSFETEVVDSRASSSRPETGIVTF